MTKETPHTPQITRLRQHAVSFSNQPPPCASFPRQTLHNSSQFTEAVGFNQAVCEEKGDGVHILPSPPTTVFREANKETLTAAIYEAMNISSARFNKLFSPHKSAVCCGLPVVITDSRAAVLLIPCHQHLLNINTSAHGFSRAEGVFLLPPNDCCHYHY